MTEQQYQAYLERIGRTAVAPLVKVRQPRKPLHAPSGYSSEAEFQEALVKRLERYGYVVLEFLKGSKNGGVVFCTKGIPDLYLVRSGIHFFIELKHGKNDRSDAQIQRHNELRNGGAHVFTCWNDPEVDLALAEMRELEDL